MTFSAGRLMLGGGGTPAPPAGLLLDDFPSAKAAYSVRLLRGAYLGSAVSVRRSSDNATQDIGFDGSGNLDESALTSFVGANDGFVVTWYDQTGNGNNATNSTGSQQAKIVSSGVVEKQGARPTTRGRASTNGYSMGFTPGRVKSIFSAIDTTPQAGATGSNTARVATSYSGSGSIGNELLVNSFNNSGSPQIRAIDGGVTVIGSHIFGFSLVSCLRSLTTLSLFSDGALVSSSGVGASVGSGNVRFFEEGGASSAEAPECMSEIVFYDTDQASNQSGIESNINAYFSIF